MTTTAEVPAEVAPAVSERRAQLRPDIQALRAVAVGSVMLFHLWPNRLSGGYVGVDVFFVISGFLITSHLVAELGRAGRIRPAQFWARRAKRLVPASTIVLVTTCLLIVNWAPHNLWRQYFHEIVTSTLQVQNWQLANNSVNYLAANNPPSPTQHFWSLSVEEQFYVCLPLLIIAAAAIAGKLGLAVSRVVAGMLALIFVASLVYSVWLTSTTPSVAYFSTFTRAWEFAAGALLACLAPMARRVNPVVPWVGLAAITLACVSYSGGTAFPGYAAALPVGGAVLVIWSARDTLFGRLGLVPPVAFLGRVSYAAYLWHWPLVVLVPEITGRPLDTVDKLSIIGFTLLVSWLSTKFVEETIRFSPRLLGRRRPRTVAAWCASAMALVVIFGSLGDNWQKHRNDDLALQTTQIVEKMPPCLGAQAMDPALAPCVDHALDGLLVPAPAQAASDDANRQECWGYDAAGQPKLCHLGPASGYTKKIYAIGDSHSNNLIGVYAKIADHNNWRIDVSGTGGCYLSTAQQKQTSDEAASQCVGFRSAVTRNADKGGYDAIIVTHSSGDMPIVPEPGQTVQEATVHGLVEAWNQLPNVPIIAIRDNPRMPGDPATCVIAHRGATDLCASPRSTALISDGQVEAAAQVPRVRVIDLTSFYCTATLCPEVIGHVLVYRDRSHITATYASTLEPYIERRIVPILAK